MSNDMSSLVWPSPLVGTTGVLRPPAVQLVRLLSHTRYAYAMLVASEVSASAVIIEFVLFCAISRFPLIAIATGQILSR